MAVTKSNYFSSTMTCLVQYHPQIYNDTPALELSIHAPVQQIPHLCLQAQSALHRLRHGILTMLLQETKHLQWIHICKRNIYELVVFLINLRSSSRVKRSIIVTVFALSLRPRIVKYVGTSTSLWWKISFSIHIDIVYETVEWKYLLMKTKSSSWCSAMFAQTKTKTEWWGLEQDFDWLLLMLYRFRTPVYQCAQ